MMIRKVVIGASICVMLALVTAGDVLAWRKKSEVKETPKEIKKEMTAQEQSPVEKAKEQQLAQEKNILIGNINTMRNQEITVNVLQQLLNREFAELKRMQAVFCDQYGLNPDKWRQGLYEYDAAKGRFIEKAR